MDAGIDEGAAADELALEPGEYNEFDDPGDTMIRFMECGECAGIKCSSLLKQKKRNRYAISIRQKKKYNGYRILIVSVTDTKCKR